MNNGTTEQWAELDRSPTPPLRVAIPSRGLNTAYNLRGRGYNTMFGGGNNSPTFGTFLSYQDDSIPTVNVSGLPRGSDSIDLSWSVSSSACYAFGNVSVSCNSANPVMVGAGETSRSVTGLQADTGYTCVVSGVFTEVVESPVVREVVAASARANTFPRSECM